MEKSNSTIQNLEELRAVVTTAQFQELPGSLKKRIGSPEQKKAVSFDIITYID